MWCNQNNITRKTHFQKIFYNAELLILLYYLKTILLDYPFDITKSDTSLNHIDPKSIKKRWTWNKKKKHTSLLFLIPKLSSKIWKIQRKMSFLNSFQLQLELKNFVHGRFNFMLQTKNFIDYRLRAVILQEKRILLEVTFSTLGWTGQVIK